MGIFNKKVFKKIKFSIIKYYVGLFMLMILLILGGVYYYSSKTIKNLTRKNLTKISENFYKNMTIKQKELQIKGDTPREIQISIYRELLDEIGTIEKIENISIIVKDRKNRYITNSRLKKLVLNDEAMDVVIDKTKNILPENSKLLKVDYNYAYLNTTYNLLGTIYEITFLMPMDEYETYLYNLNNFFILIIVISIILAIIVGNLLSKKIIFPIKKINKITKKITSKNLEERIEYEDNGDEISELITIINSMIQRLEESFKKQKRFVSDASHELRTPLLIILGYAELLEKWGLEEREIALEAIKNISDEGKGIKKILDELLFLAREDSGENLVHIKKINLYDIFNSLKKKYRILGKEVKIECQNNIYIDGDEKLLTQMLKSLLDNAFKFSENQEVILGVGEESLNLDIYVKDRGIGIPEDKMKIIFNRFVKLEEHRNRNDSGCGLGLSIVKEILLKHDWSIRVESEEGKGSKFIVTVKGDQKV